MSRPVSAHFLSRTGSAGRLRDARGSHKPLFFRINKMTDGKRRVRAVARAQARFGGRPIGFECRQLVPKIDADDGKQGKSSHIGKKTRQHVTAFIGKAGQRRMNLGRIRLAGLARYDRIKCPRAAEPRRRSEAARHATVARSAPWVTVRRRTCASAPGGRERGPHRMRSGASPNCATPRFPRGRLARLSRA